MRAEVVLLVSILVLAAAAEAAPQALPQPANFNPRSIELFERDWVLMQWARKQYDRDGDGMLSKTEAQPAASAFKAMADGDRDGRVTTYEYDRAREFILARY